MKALGITLLVAGFLVGAFLTSLDPEQVNWMYFVPVIAIGAGGVYMMKQIEMADARSDSRLADNRQVIDQSIDNIVSNLDVLNTNTENIPGWEMRFEIDKRFRTDLNTFVEARKSLVHIYGLQAYADIMSPFAAGERYLNRVWSASTDGYFEEVTKYLGRAHTQFIEVRQKLDQVHEQQSAQKS